MPQTPHTEHHFTGSEIVRDIVIGMSDGLTVPFALAAGLSTGALHGNQAAAEKGLVVKDLGEAGPSPTFRIGQVASRTHQGSPLFRGIYLI